ncbi:hypothetical protein MSG28_009243 [Choristoneura fumiferana]|uniref:Uncharacterized protein n=1 Tax=Choristoneura fumiferana TaxID=7141 RepID=A0ACC0KXM9_CHOFU|nr:hypothetical protein MSG28_009243 [Choristoneura fumiferana]
MTLIDDLGKVAGVPMGAGGRVIAAFLGEVLCPVRNYSVEHVDKVCLSLREQYGRCVKMAGLLGRPDMLFVFDAGEVERVFRSEDGTPHRHGESWSAFRTKVSRVALSTSAAAQYTVSVSDVADSFINRLRDIRKEDYETPDDFTNEVHKWSLEFPPPKTKNTHKSHKPIYHHHHTTLTHFELNLSSSSEQHNYTMLPDINMSCSYHKFEALGLIALDTRLGCFEASAGSESQRLIDAVNTFFLCVGELELRAPWWRIYNTRMFKQYVNALDTILR